MDSDPKSDQFAGHYYAWRSKRIRAIVEKYGAEAFRGARVLELGCGYGDIGMAFHQLGADVTFAEGRQEHLDVLHDRYPFIPQNKLVCYDAEDPWPFARDEFDIVLNLGLVYHVDRWDRSIIGSISSAPVVVLETEVCDSDDPTFVVKTEEEGYDQSLTHVGSRPSAEAVEHVVRVSGSRYERLTDNRCNAGIHEYDWPVTNSGDWRSGLRRFWFCERQ